MSFGRYKNLWEMRQPGLHGERQIFKCTECGAETHSPAGWNGAPDRHKCRPDCRCNQKLTIVRPADFGKNFDRIRFGTLAAEVPVGPGANPVAEARRAYRENFDRIFGGAA